MINTISKMLNQEKKKHFKKNKKHLIFWPWSDFFIFLYKIIFRIKISEISKILIKELLFHISKPFDLIAEIE